MRTGLPLKELLTTGTESVAVNMKRSIAKGFPGGADTLTVGSQTKVVGNTDLAPGDVVAGGLVALSGESASTVWSTPLQLVVDYAPASSSSTAANAEQMKRVERRALEMLRQEKAKFVRHDKHGTH
jgi:hypothetical protein